MVKCYREDCAAPATRQIRGIPMCDREYIEALEHGAHIVSAVPIQPKWGIFRSGEPQK